MHIVGTERHESRRIDNQLRGRAARQGDPGSSVFFLSLEDDLLKRFGGERLKKIAQVFKIDESTPIQLKILTKQISAEQKKIEIQNFSTRKTVLQFDDVMNAQRKIIYEERNKVLDGLPMHEQILGMFPGLIHNIVQETIDDDKPYFEWDLAPINAELERGWFEKGSNIVDEKFVEDCDAADVEEKILQLIYKRYAQREEEAKELNINFENIERFVMLKVVDAHWMNHIDDMQIMKNEMMSRSYGNQDPVLAYKKEGFELFEDMIEKIRKTTCQILLVSHFQVEGERKPVKKPTFTPIARKEQPVQEKTKDEKPFVQKTVVNDLPKVGRNQPCPCGSGKKYKNCCGK